MIPLFILITAFLCVFRRELRALFMILYRKANARMRKVEKKHHCLLCGAPPSYMLHLVEITHAETASPFAGTELHVCREHHPNEKFAPKADELHKYIEHLDANLTYDRVYPYSYISY